jgi:hypothetical protein
MVPAGSTDPITGAAHGESQHERHGLQQPQLHPSQQHPLAATNSISPVRVENKRFIPGFLSCGIEAC